MSAKHYKNPEKFDPDHFSAEAVKKRSKNLLFIHLTLDLGPA